MKTSAQTVVIGGGIFGTSIVYHLAKEGWQDTVLIEKGELASGTTWHAAGQCPHFIGSLVFGHIHHHGIQLYQSLEAETGQATGWVGSGSIRLARDEEELDWHRNVAGIARQIGYEFHVVGLDEIRRLNPFMELHDVVGGAYTPGDGYVDPTSATNALAIGASQRGVEINRRTLVTNVSRRAGGEWLVETEKGDITCEHVVLATGFFSPQVGEWMGLRIPTVNMVHQFLVTESVPQLAALEKRLPIVRDPTSHSYFRHDQDGLLGGPYEDEGVQSVYHDGVPWSFETDLLPPDLDRISPWLDLMMDRMPLFKNAGVKNTISAFIAHAPDIMPMLGPVAGHPNLWLACGAAIGIAQGPGCGKALAQWMVHGAAELNMQAMDPRRYGEVHTDNWVHDRTHEATQHLFEIHPPGHCFESGRPLRTSGVHDRLAEKGAVFAESMGWERPTWFSPTGETERYSFRRNNSFDRVGEECRAVRERVGVLDLSGFAKLEVSGRGAADFLDGVVANRLPRRDGGVVLAHILAPNGVIDAEMTITRLGPNRFYLLSGASSEVRDHDLLSQNLKPGGDVTIANVSDARGCLAVTGPRAREVMAQLSDADFTGAGFPWLSAREIEVAGYPALALRVSYAGELGWELHLPAEHLTKVYDALFEAGEAHGIANFGFYALNSLRMEKAYRGFGTELTNEVSPLDAGMERFVDWDKANFLGREALLARRESGPVWDLLYGTIDVADRDVVGSEPVLSGDRVVGSITSGAYGHVSGQTIAFTYVRKEQLGSGDALEVEMLGQRYGLAAHPEPLYDPGNAKLRA